jgi:hypothetical protein
LAEAVAKVLTCKYLLWLFWKPRINFFINRESRARSRTSAAGASRPISSPSGIQSV